MNNNKFHLHCTQCGYDVADFKEWFEYMQKCPKCGCAVVDVQYSKDYSALKDMIFSNGSEPKNLWHYFDFLPLNNRENIISRGEGVIPLEQWGFLEKYAKEKFGLSIKVHAYRNDLNPGTGTFKDVAASVASSVLKENGVKEFCIASTGNIANAYSHYLADAGISIAVFVPNDVLKANEAEVNSYGQKLFKVKGDYAAAKHVAAEYSKKYSILMSGGNVDPMRVEAKKTMVFEWLRQIGEVPNVYVQALSGGTGPIAIEKAYKDLKGLDLVDEMPRFIMVQPSGCAPMTHGWEKAKEDKFPEGWLFDYPIYENPITKVPTLATGKPGTYPIIADLVKRSKGEIIEFNEEYLVDIARAVAFENTVRMGPAAAVAVGGFFKSLNEGIIKEGDNVLVNVGEGVRRAPDFVEEMMYTTESVDSIEECERFDRSKYREGLWNRIDKMFS
ncbi:MAG: pyridoxal-phosphate dependent enzyme [Salinivirgaceae bacterium]|jgi:threonine synthase|nr:pyridoxal-phosphate dependent enzyme [Salinivirgaceae bacterium]